MKGQFPVVSGTVWWQGIVSAALAVETVQMLPTCLVNGRGPSSLPDALSAALGTLQTPNPTMKGLTQKRDSGLSSFWPVWSMPYRLLNIFNVIPHDANQDGGQKMSRMEAPDLGMALSPVTHWALPNLSALAAVTSLHQNTSTEQRP